MLMAKAHSDRWRSFAEFALLNRPSTKLRPHLGLFSSFAQEPIA